MCAKNFDRLFKNLRWFSGDREPLTSLYLNWLPMEADGMRSEEDIEKWETPSLLESRKLKSKVENGILKGNHRQVSIREKVKKENRWIRIETNWWAK